jgi:predicted dithiol-disulfide oxidoreductase (DUF899 family)
MPATSCSSAKRSTPRLGDDLARQRRELPWVPVDKEYRFEADEGTRTLAELFDGRSQLLVYHFMFGPSYEAGCPTCSSMVDGLDGLLSHLHARDLTLLLVSRAQLARLQAYKQRMGWRIPWVSSANTDFNFDFGASYPEEQVREQMPPEASCRRSRVRTRPRPGPTFSHTSRKCLGQAPSRSRTAPSTKPIGPRDAESSS